MQTCVSICVWVWAVFSSFLADDHRWRWLEKVGGWPGSWPGVCIQSVWLFEGGVDYTKGTACALGSSRWDLVVLGRDGEMGLGLF